MVTVIIPVFNGENHIRKSVKSILDQTFNSEIIIVNDGSVDDTSLICEELSMNNENIKIFSTENKGVAHARNIGIKESKTKYVCFLDSDDSYETNFVELMLNQIEKTESDICYCGSYDVSGKKKKTKRIKYTTTNLLENYLKNKSTPNTNCWLINKNFLLEKKVFFDENNNFGEDMIFFSKLLINEPKITYVAKPLTNYNLDVPNSLSKKSNVKIESDIHWCLTVSDLIKASAFQNQKKEVLINILKKYRLSLSILQSIKKSNASKDEKKALLSKYSEYIYIYNFSNGLRSLKGIISYIFLKIELL